MPKSKQSDSEKMTEYEKERMKRIEENKARMKAMGLDKMASSFISSVPLSLNQNQKGKKKVHDDDDDDEYKPSVNDNESISESESDEYNDDDDDDDEFCVKPKSKKTTPSKKSSKLSGNSGYIDDDEALMKAIALSLQDSAGFLDVASKTPPESSDKTPPENSDKTPPESSDKNASSVESTKRKQIARKDDSGKRNTKKLNGGAGKQFKSRVQLTEDELILHFFQFDEVGKGGINVWDLQRVAASHDFTWDEDEMEHMIHFFDSDGDGKLSLEDFTKIVERCNMRQGSENPEQASLAS